MKAPKSKKTLPENQSPSLKFTLSQSTLPAADDDDDFQDPFQSLPLTQNTLSRKHSSSSSSKSSCRISSLQPLKPSNSAVSRPSKKPKRLSSYATGKENLDPSLMSNNQETQTSYAPCDLGLDVDCGLESIMSTSSHEVELDAPSQSPDTVCSGSASLLTKKTDIPMEKVGLQPKGGCKYASNSIESRLLRSNLNCPPIVCENDRDSDEDNFEPGTQLDVLIKLCSEADEQFNHSNSSDLGGGFIQCPMCGVDISDLSDEMRYIHTNECLDKGESPSDVTVPDNVPQQECPGQVLNISPSRSPGKIDDVSPVLYWLRSLGLARYEDVFIQEEIDWDSLQWLTEEDLCSIGITALGPRKKIVHALSELRKEGTKTVENHADVSTAVDVETSKQAPTKLITDYFPGFTAANKRVGTTSTGKNDVGKSHSKVGRQVAGVKKHASNKKLKDIPLWCSIPCTPFRVDAFKYLRRDCSHWFLTHFHTDHYQGLTKSFCHGKIYCSLVTAKLVNLKIGIPWDKLEILPLNQKISISGIDVTCFDANHCPGSIIILFEPPNGKAVLHTGDFRFCEEMAKLSILQTCPIHTLILDTTYCDPQYDFPKQDAVIQFVIDAIQAESFNPKTLFLIGSYTIGKEKLFLEVARVLRKKVYVPAAKLRLLESLGFSKEDMLWFTTKEQDSHIHVVPMWTLASFKRLKHISNQYMKRFSLIVAFSPTGWTFGKGKKSSPGRRWQQGTIIRYEVPYSEHCSFTELKEFVKFISPVNIIPSVNNHGPESTTSMLSLLLS